MDSADQIIKIAIADDHKLFREGIAKILQAYKKFDIIIEADDGDTLVKKIKTSSELPNVVLLDIRMPVMNGFDTAEILIHDFPSIKIIILSMHDNPRHIIRMIELGVNGYLFKNAPPKDFIESIELVLENDFYFNNKINSIIQKVFRYRGMHPAYKEFPVPITPREKEVLELICKEHTTKEIADILCLSPRTIEGHRKNLISKLGVRNVAGLVVYAIKQELVDL